MTNELPTVAPGAQVAPADLMSAIAIDADSNAGFDGIGADDLALPFISILQSNSPQVKVGEKQIEGAAEGDFLNTVTGEIYKREFRAIPCAYRKAYIEWTPREAGGGFLGEHNEAILSQCTKNDKFKDVLPNGNLIVPTAYHYVLVVKADGSYERAVISFTSTQLKKSRKWNSTMMALLIDVGGVKRRPPMFSHSYKMATVREDNAQGSWMGWQISEPMIITDAQLYVVARGFAEEAGRGGVKISTPHADAASIVPSDDSEVM